jgi:hypothetical protein
LPDPAVPPEVAREELLGARIEEDWRLVAESQSGRGMPLVWHMQPRILDVVQLAAVGMEPHVGVIASDSGLWMLQALGPRERDERGDRLSQAVDLNAQPWSRWVVAIYRPPEGQEATL